MLKECLENEEYAAASKSQGPQRSTESLFMALIFQQQKMVSRLMKQIQSNSISLKPQEEQTTYLVAAVELNLRHTCGWENLCPISIQCKKYKKH
ncbi:MAG: hypothetical protein M3297_07545 [Thermoproteota archaeon]|nr:hypothetical protein [Thermoproteota archaeon]